MKCAVLSENQTEYIRNCGKIVAPLYYNFADFVAVNAKHPIHISYRSAYPIKHALDHLNVESNPLWINRAVAEKLSKPIIQKYCIQQKLYAPFTFVDNGYMGTIPDTLRDELPWKTDLQTIFLITHGCKLENFTAYMTEDFTHHASLTASRYKLSNLIESIPSEYRDYGVPDFKHDSNGTICVNPSKQSPVKCTLAKTFFAGMKEGYTACDTRETHFHDYLNLLAEGVEGMELYHTGETPWNARVKIQRACSQIDKIYAR